VEIVKGIHRVGSNKVNVYLVEEAGSVTIVDAGLPGYWSDVAAELTVMGRTFEDVRAVILTHAHDDHIGFAERIRTENGTPVEVHEADAALARGEAKTSNEGGGSYRPLPVISFLVYAIRKGYLRTKRIGEVGTFADGATLDVPGSPRVIHVPGHTAGSAAFHLAARNAIIVGDAIVTLNVVNGQTGPRLFPNFNADNRQAVASLERLDAIEARYVLPGHGDPWTGGLTDALRRVRGTLPDEWRTAG
jgi:glyoxylase-like metal-dependent hydrolase (beta-lactamase superfamily II)